MADDFSEFGGFADGGGSTAVATSPTSAASDEFEQFGGQPLSPQEQGQDYVANLGTNGAPLPSAQDVVNHAGAYLHTSATGRDLGALWHGMTGGASTDPDYQAVEQTATVPGTGGITLADLRASGGVLGNFAANTLHGIGNLESAAYDKLSAIGQEQQTDAQRHGVAANVLHNAEAGVIALPGAAYNVVKPLVSLAGGVVVDGATDLKRAIGKGDEAVLDEAGYDLNKVRAEQAVEPTLASISSASPLPATTSAIEQVAPAVVPLGAVSEGLGLVDRSADALAYVAPKIVGRSLQGVGKVAEIAADQAPKVGGLAAISSVMHGGDLGHAILEGAIGKGAQLAKPLATGLKTLGQGVAARGPSQIVAQVARPVLTVGIGGGTAALMDSQSAPAPILVPPWQQQAADPNAPILAPLAPLPPVVQRPILLPR